MASQAINAQYTEAPWTLERGQKPPNRLSIYGARGSSICTIWTHDDEMAWANGSLLRTAPELLKACIKAREKLGPDDELDTVIAKAHGTWRPWMA